MAERARRISIWNPAIVGQAITDSFVKLDPRVQIRNPVMFIVEAGSGLTTIVWIRDIIGGSGNTLFTGLSIRRHSSMNTGIRLRSSRSCCWMSGRSPSTRIAALRSFAVVSWPAPNRKVAVRTTSTTSGVEPSGYRAVAKPVSAADFLPLLYGELRAIAAKRLRAERRNHTLQPTALVHEVFLKLRDRAGFQDEQHFLATAARAMRQILVDHARARQAAKRSGHRVSLNEASMVFIDDRIEDVLEILKELVKEQTRTQVLMTTHSPYLVDLLDPAEATLCTKGQDGSINLKRLSESELVRQQKSIFTLGEIWTSEGDEDLASDRVVSSAS